MAKKRRSLQDKLRQKRADSFIGREEELQLFRTNLQANSDSDDFYHIFNIYGQGGVGKTTLVRRYESLVKASNHLSTYTDEGINSVIEFMNSVVEQLKSQGLTFKDFSERYKKLLQERQRLETDPEAPQGWLGFLTGTAIKGGLEITQELVPGSSMVLGKLDKDGLAKQGGELIEFLRKKISNKDEVELILNPEKVLTPLFIKEFQEYSNPVDFYLFIDTYEFVSTFIDDWLRGFIEGIYGEFPSNIVFTIAGRNDLNINLWSAYSSIMHKCSLEPFTDKEAIAFLQLKNVTSPHIVETILSLSHNLPVLLATLAEAAPSTSNSVTDPTDTAVERFLKWIQDPIKRDLALFAALPRKLNQDIVEVLLEEPVDSASLFQWLCNRPFVQKRGGFWAYHPIVKDLMVKYLYQKSLRQWELLQKKLISNYQGLLKSTENWESENWRANKIELIFHELCLVPGTQKGGIQQFVAIFRKLGSGTAIQVAENIIQTEKLFNESGWGVILQTGMAALSAGEWSGALKLFQKLNASKFIENSSDKAFLLFLEGFFLQKDKQLYEAVECYLQAIEFKPDDEAAWYNMGLAYYKLENQQKAIECYLKAIEFKPDNEAAWSNLGNAYYKLENQQKAIECYLKAIKFKPDYEAAWSNLGNAYYKLENQQKAIECYLKAIEFKPDYGAAWSNLGNAYYKLGNQQKAIECYLKAIEFKPDNEAAWYNMGLAYYKLENQQKAIECYLKAIEFKSDYEAAWSNLGNAYGALGDQQKAIECYLKAIEFKPDYEAAWSNLGNAYYKLENQPKAIECYLKAIEFKPDYEAAWSNLGNAYGALGDQPKAIECYLKAIEFKPDYEAAWSNLGNAYYKLENQQKAIECYLKVIEFKPDVAYNHGSLGWGYLTLRQTMEARASLLKAWELSEEKDYQYPVNIGHTFLVSKDKNQAIKWYQISLSLLDKTEEFFKGMEQDYEDLKMKESDIDRDYYNQILEELKSTDKTSRPNK